jgi:hypothetical protein
MDFLIEIIFHFYDRGKNYGFTSKLKDIRWIFFCGTNENEVQHYNS